MKTLVIRLELVAEKSKLAAAALQSAEKPKIVIVTTTPLEAPLVPPVYEPPPAIVPDDVPPPIEDPDPLEATDFDFTCAENSNLVDLASRIKSPAPLVRVKKIPSIQLTAEESSRLYVCFLLSSIFLLLNACTLMQRS